MHEYGGEIYLLFANGGKAMNKNLTVKEHCLAVLIKEINSKYFNDRLPTFVPRFTSRLKSGARYDTHKYSLVVGGDVSIEFYIVEFSESMAVMSLYDVSTELFVQMALLFGQLHDLSFVSRHGYYFNESFKSFMQSKGFQVTKSPSCGWCIVTPSEKFTRFIDGIKVNF